MKNSESILNIFKKYSSYDYGYLTLQYPTGNGKTYYLIKFLVEILANDFKDLEKYDKERIIVVTNNKINLKEIYDEVIKNLKKQKLESKEKEIFWLKSLTDILSEINFLKEIYSNLDSKMQFYSNILEKDKNFIKKFKTKLREIINNIEEKREVEVYKELEEFILVVKNEMLKYLKKSENKVILPKFLEKLYPMILEKNRVKRLYIMTTDKFLYGFVGENKVEFFYEDYKKSLIFIDEVDSTKEKFLKFTRENKTLTVKNIINTFNERYNSFSKKDNNLLRKLIGDIVEKRIEDIEKENYNINEKKEKEKKLEIESKKIKQEIRIFEKRGKKLRDKYFTAKKYFEIERKERIDLFEENNNFLFEGKELYIKFKKNKCLITEEITTIKLTVMLKELFEYIYFYFYKLIENIYAFHISISEEKEVEREIISHLFYNTEAQKIILNEYKNFYILKFKTNKNNWRKQRDKCCYVEIYEEIPEYTLNKKVAIGYQYMYITPEELFYNICLKNFVFGISATAELETCIGNYDLKWLKEKLGKNYFNLEENEKIELSDRLSYINSFEEKIQRKLNIFNGSGLYENISNGNFENIDKFMKKNKKMSKELEKLYINYCEITIDELKEEYHLSYFTFEVLTILNFIFEKNTNSLLFLGNRFSHGKILKEFFLNLEKILNIKINIEIISAKNLDEKLKVEDSKILKKLGLKDEKTIIFTTFQSAGVGVNIKYRYSSEFEKHLIKIDKKIEKKEKFSLEYKDIDEIALEHKTNLFHYDEISNDKIILLYNCNLLLRNGIIDKKQRALLLESNDIVIKKIYMGTIDYVENAIGKIIQGIGRISRTKVRNKKRNIYIDEEVKRVLLNFYPKDRLFIRDFNFLLDKIHNFEEVEKNNELLEIIRMKNTKAEVYYRTRFIEAIAEYNRKIRVLKDSGLKKEIENKLFRLWKEYEKQREYILKNPTLPKGDSDIYYFSIGMKLDRYCITYVNNQLSKISIPALIKSRFHENEKKKISSDANISKKSCKIDLINKIPALKKFCEENIGNFREDDRIILPYVFQAVYLGKLGEVVIKELFSMYNIKLKDIKEIIKNGMVEVFDDITISGMRIDYKNYDLDNISNREFLIKIIRKKIEKVKEFINKEKKLFIINMIEKKQQIRSRNIYFYKIEDILEIKETGDIRESSYKESEVVVVTGVLKYGEDKNTLEINTNILENLKLMFEMEGENE